MKPDAHPTHPNFLSAANLLTFSRIALIPVFIALFVTDGFWAAVFALGLAVYFELSDMLDGFVARRFGESSDFGALFDPFADRVSRFTIFLCFLHGGFAGLWVVACIFIREALVSFIRVWAARSQVVLSARISGKVKAVFQGSAIVTICLLRVLQSRELVEGLEEISQIIMIVVAVVTLLSGVDYVISSASFFRTPPPE